MGINRKLAGRLSGGICMSGDKYFIVKKGALPEVLLKVVEAKRLLDTERAMTVQEATDAVDISRSSFYKYRNDIFPFYENTRGRTITIMFQMDDKSGLLAMVLKQVAKCKANILTIHQSIPVNGIALLTLSIEILPQTDSTSILIEEIEAMDGIHFVKIVSRE
jgi:chorismate mutase